MNPYLQQKERLIVKHWLEYSSIEDKESLTRTKNLTKITVGELKSLDKLIYRKRELSASQAKNKLNLRACSRTIQNYLNKLGWKKITTKCCHFVSVKNRIERVLFCNFCIITKETFHYSIFIDECTVMMNKNARTQWFRSGLAGETKSGLKPKYKHAASIHLIGGISRRGKTKLMIFSGMLNAPGFLELADEFMVPFVREVYPEHHSIHMDNNSFHFCAETYELWHLNSLNVFKHPAQSPDLNVIELVWNVLKAYIGSETNPNTVQELILGIMKFWNEKVTVEYCNAKINHMSKVIDRILVLDGKASGL